MKSLCGPPIEEASLGWQGREREPEKNREITVCGGQRSCTERAARKGLREGQVDG